MTRCGTFTRAVLCMSVLAALVALTSAAAVAPVVCGGIYKCPPGWTCVHGACALPCTTPHHNSLQGLCSGGADPFAGVYCNSKDGSAAGILVTDRYDVMNTVKKCKTNYDCIGYGHGYFCNVFTPTNDTVHDHPAPACARPAAPACFPLVPVCWDTPKCGAANGVCPP